MNFLAIIAIIVNGKSINKVCDFKCLGNIFTENDK